MANAQQADIFLIPLLDGSHAAGQIIESEETPENAVLCLLTLRLLDTGTTPTPIGISEMIALVMLRPDHLNDGTWPVIGFEQLPPVENVFQLKAAKANRFADIQIHDAAVIEAFVNACHGHYPWDGFPDPEFFDTLLVKRNARPPKARMQADFSA